MANRFWVGGTGNWDTTTTTNWSATSGGAGGASAPTAADDVFFDGSSGVGTTTIVNGAVCRSLNCTGFTGTISHPAGGVTLTIGDATAGASNIAIKLVAGMTYTASNSSSTIAFASTSATQQTIDMGGKNIGSLQFNGVGGNYILSSAITSVANGLITHTRGTLNTNNFNVTVGFYSSSNGNTRTLTLGSSTVTLNGSSGTHWDFGTTTGLTFNAGTSTIIVAFTSTMALNFGGLTYNNFTVTCPGGISCTMNGNGTFTNFTINGAASTYNPVNVGGDWTITGLYTLGGNSAINRLRLISTGVGTPRTMTINGTVSAQNTDFTDIAFTGTAAPLTGTSLGDASGNSGITFTAAVTRYRVGAGGNWSATANWSTSSGGAGGASVPLPQDNAIIDGNATGTVTIDLYNPCKNIDFTGFVGTLSMGVSPYVYGNVTLSSGMTFSGAGTLTMAGRSGSYTITTNGKTITSSFEIRCVSGTVIMQDALTITGSGGITITAGTLNMNSFSLTAVSLNGNNSAVKGITGGTGATINLTGTSGNLVNILATNTTLSLLNTNVAITTTSASSRTLIWPANAQLNNLTYTVAGSTGSLIIQNGIDINDINFSDSVNIRTLQINASQTLNIRGLFNVFGASGRLITIQSSSTTNHTITKSSGFVISDYLIISDSSASGGAYFAAGNNSTDGGGGNTGWVFGAASFALNVADTVSVIDGNRTAVTNDSFDNAPAFTAATSTIQRWINGQAAGSSVYIANNWRISGSGTGQVSAQYDSSAGNTLSGSSMKINLLNPGSYAGVNPLTANNLSEMLRAGFPVTPGKKYTVQYWMKTAYVSGDSNNGATMAILGTDANGTITQTHSGSYVKTTTDWTKYTITFTAAAGEVYAYPEMRLYGHTGAASLVMTAWFDEIKIFEDRPIFTLAAGQADNVITTETVAKAFTKLLADSVTLSDGQSLTYRPSLAGAQVYLKARR